MDMNMKFNSKRYQVLPPCNKSIANVASCCANQSYSSGIFDITLPLVHYCTNQLLPCIPVFWLLLLGK